MLKVYHSLSELSFGCLMTVYEESNRLNARELYGNLDANAAVLQVEQDFYAYLQECFFQTKGAWYAIWEEQGRYVSALRMEPYEDGMLLEALETAPDFRGRGYARKLINAALQQVDCGVYSHVSKDNIASYQVHLDCGFSKVSDRCVYIDGTESESCCTLLRRK